VTPFARRPTGQNRAAMRGLSGDELLHRPVQLHGIRLGFAADVILDAGASRVLGFDVLCGDGEHRFLPFAASHPSRDRIAVTSALALLDEPELAFYRDHGTTLLAFRRAGGGDLVLAEDGSVEPADAPAERPAV